MNPGKNREKKNWRQKWPANDRCSGTEPTKGSLVAFIYLFHWHPTFQVTLLFQESCVVLLDVMWVYIDIIDIYTYIYTCIYYLFFKRNTFLSQKKYDWLHSQLLGRLGRQRSFSEGCFFASQRFVFFRRGSFVEGPQGGILVTKKPAPATQ